MTDTIPTTVYFCAFCDRWLIRIPAHWDGPSSDWGDRCDECGGAVFYTKPGRPIGPKSKNWSGLFEALKAELKGEAK